MKINSVGEFLFFRRTHCMSVTFVFNPPDRGINIMQESSTTGCVKAFTPLSFGVILDEPAKCKIDYERKPTFDEMSQNIMTWHHSGFNVYCGKAI